MVRPQPIIIPNRFFTKEPRILRWSLALQEFSVTLNITLEYNSVIWSPHLKCDIEAIERVQRRFTKRLPVYHKYSYSERLRLLQLPSLETYVFGMI